MVRNRGIAVRLWIEPDFVAASGLTVELEATGPELTDDLSVPKSGQTAHLRRDHDQVISPFARCWQVRNPVAFAPSFDQFPSDIACDLKRLGNRPPLRYEARKLIRGREEQAFRQFLHLYSNRQLHTLILPLAIPTRVPGTR